MRIAAIYDIHGNLPALEAVVGEIRRIGVDCIIVGGDVLPGPLAVEALAYLLDLGITTQFIVGNGDRAVLEHIAGSSLEKLPEAAREVIRWNAQQLDPEQQRCISSWPKTLRLEVDGIGSVLFCHATPRNDTEMFTRVTDEERLVPVFAGANANLVVCGHTHMQFERTVGNTRVVNAGSAGMPYGDPGAYWLLLGPDVELRRSSYDFQRAADRIRQTAYPQAEDFASRSILVPPSEEEMLKLFSRAELK